MTNNLSGTNAISQANSNSVTQETTDARTHIAMIGVSGVGKTCFLAGLAKIGRDVKSYAYNLNSEDGDTTAYFERLENAWDGEKPSATDIKSKTLNFEMTVSDAVNRRYRIIDYRGEEYQSNSHDRKEQVPEFKDHLNKSEIWLIFIDAEEIDKISRCDDKTRSVKEGKLFEKLKDTIDGIRNTCKSNGKRREVAVVLTKIDSVECLRNATEKDIKKYVNEKLGKFEDNLKNSLCGICRPELSYFGISALGDAKSKDRKPIGYEDLLKWVGKHSERLKAIEQIGRRRIFRAVIAGAIVLCAVIGVVMGPVRKARVQRQIKILEDTRLRTDELVAIDPINEEAVDAQNNVWNKEKSSFSNNIEDASDVDTVNRLTKELNDLTEKATRKDIRNDIQELIKQANGKKETLEYNEIKTIIQTEPQKALTDIDAFLRNYPGSSRVDELQTDKENILIELYDNETRKIIAIDVRDNSTLNNKIVSIESFLKNKNISSRLTEEETEEINNAIKVADMFCKENYYKVTVGHYGKFLDKRYGNEVELRVMSNGNKVCSDKASDVTERNPNKPFDLQAKYGDNFKVELYADTTVFGSQHVVASWEGKDISVFADELSLIPDPDETDIFENNEVKVKFTLSYNDPSGKNSNDQQQIDAIAFRNWICPGKKWRKEFREPQNAEGTN